MGLRHASQGGGSDKRRELWEPTGPSPPAQFQVGPWGRGDEENLEGAGGSLAERGRAKVPGVGLGAGTYPTRWAPAWGRA